MDNSEPRDVAVFSTKFRAGSSPLHPLALLRRCVFRRECILAGNDLPTGFQSKISKLVKDLGVHPHDTDYYLDGPTELVWQSHDKFDPTGKPTILVVAEWDDTSPDLWERAVKAVKRFIDSESHKSGQLDNFDIGVEMIAPELLQEKFVHVPKSEFTTMLTEYWPHILDKVDQLLESHPATSDKVNSISLFELGRSEFESKGKNPLTVYISVDLEADEREWPAVADDIQAFLDTYALNMRVHLEHGTFGFKETEEEIGLLYNIHPLACHGYQTKVNLGDDLGPPANLDSESDPGAGTLGCWVEIKTRSQPEWTKYALTSYHVARPAISGFKADQADITQGSDIWKADLNGLTPKDCLSSPPAQIEHPAPHRHH